MNRSVIFVFFLSIFILSGCSPSESGTPKPRTYPRVDFPAKKYSVFKSKDCGFQFEIPQYAKVEKYVEKISGNSANDCWYNIVFPQFKGEIYLTYFKMLNRKSMEDMINDTYQLVSKHDIKSSGRKETELHFNKDVNGILFEINGNVASHTQFYLTDSTSNFIRGSLYFNSKVNADSLEIIQNFIDKDVDQLLKSFRWK